MHTGMQIHYFFVGLFTPGLEHSQNDSDCGPKNLDSKG